MMQVMLVEGEALVRTMLGNFTGGVVGAGFLCELSRELGITTGFT